MAFLIPYHPLPAELTLIATSSSYFAKVKGNPAYGFPFILLTHFNMIQCFHQIFEIGTVAKLERLCFKLIELFNQEIRCQIAFQSVFAGAYIILGLQVLTANYCTCKCVWINYYLIFCHDQYSIPFALIISK